MEQQERTKSDSPPSRPLPEGPSLDEPPKQFYAWSVGQEKEFPNFPTEIDVEAMKR
jgi:hypothetical protein